MLDLIADRAWKKKCIGRLLWIEVSTPQSSPSCLNLLLHIQRTGRGTTYYWILQSSFQVTKLIIKEKLSRNNLNLYLYILPLIELPASLIMSVDNVNCMWRQIMYSKQYLDNFVMHLSIRLILSESIRCWSFLGFKLKSCAQNLRITRTNFNPWGRLRMLM